MMSRKYLEYLCIELRCWLESADRSSLPDEFRNFPVGACEWASCLLQMYLNLNGEDRFVAVYDISSDRGRVFLRRDDMIVDITGDQFGWPPVIVSQSSPWHCRAKTDGVSPPSWPPEMLRLCGELLKIITKNQSSDDFRTQARPSAP